MVFSTFPAHLQFSPRYHRGWKPGTTFPRILCQQGSPVGSTDEGNSQKIQERKRSRNHYPPGSHLLLPPHFLYSSPIDLFAVSQTLQEYYIVRDFALDHPFTWIVLSSDIHISLSITSSGLCSNVPYLLKFSLSTLFKMAKSILAHAIPHSCFSFLHSTYNLIHILLFNLFQSISARI